MRRHSLSRGGSKRLFAATAARHQSINYRSAPMRGGIRL